MPTLQHAQTTLHFDEAGHGPPIVLVHSGGNSHEQWRRLSGRLQDRFRLLAIDLYGHGATSPWPGSGPVTLDDDAELVISLIERQSEPVRLVGHSYGGAVALRAAIKRPELLRHLVLIEPQVYPLLGLVGDHEMYRATHDIRDRMFALIERGDVEAGVAGWFDHYSGSEGGWKMINPAARERLVSKAELITDGWRALETNPTTLDECRGLAVPTLLVTGELTTPSLRAMASLVERLVPGARQAIVAGAAHMSPITHADEVARIIREHLEPTSARPSLRSELALHVFEQVVLGVDRLVGKTLSSEGEPLDVPTPLGPWLVRHPDLGLDDASVTELFDELRRLGLPGLSLAGCRQLTQDGLAPLRSLPSLEILDLFNTAAGDATCVALGSLAQLHTLVLAGTAVTDRGIEALAGLPSLAVLDLGSTTVTSAVAATLARMPALRTLSLRGTQITDEALAQLATLPRLENLDLQQTAITDRGIATLAPLRDRLVRLYLGYTPVTDVCLEGMHGFSRLTTLMLRGTAAVPSGELEALLERRVRVLPPGDPLQAGIIR